MRADLKRIKLLFKTKTQPINNNSGQGGDECHNTEEDEWMHSGDAKIADMVGEHFQTKEKIKIREKW
jgi:hypothetical protein